MSRFLGCGVAGLVLDREEERLLDEIRPGGIVLFARNVESCEQLVELVRTIRALPSRPLVAIDMEGGRVNRLRSLIGPLPAPAAAAVGGTEAVRALGEAVGVVCAFFGIDVDFAPVVDVARADGYLGGEGRCLGSTAGDVERAGRAYLDGLESTGVRACLKHFPGLGSGEVDSHQDLPVADENVRQDMQVFAALASPQRAVMVGHELVPQLGDAYAPASLSRVVIDTLCRDRCGPVFSDDLEMGALARYGSLAERAAAALLAGCDQVLVCNSMEERQVVASHIAGWATRERTVAAAVARSARRLADFAPVERRPVSWDEVLAAVEKARALAGEDT